jgi:hypothetical protein
LDSNFLLDAADRFREGKPFEQVVDLWVEIWRVAIAASVLSRFTARSASVQAIGALDEAAVKADELRERYRPLVFSEAEVLDPLQALGRLLDRYPHERAFSALRREARLGDLESELARILHQYKPMHFFIDGLDEFAGRDPRSWLEVQAGLYKLVFLRDFGRGQSKLVYLTISLRKYVYSEAKRLDGHGDREGGVYQLQWDARAAQRFLDSRLWSARKKLAGKKELKHGRPLASWLGVEEITPPRRGRPEAVESYVIRHTRCTPRQIIKMVHAFDDHIKVQPSLPITDRDIRSLVARCASENADNALMTAAEELISQIGCRSFRRPNNRFVENALVAFVAERLGLAIKHCRVEVTTLDELKSWCLSEMGELVPEELRDDLPELIVGVLWRSGIFAYRDREDHHWTYTWSPQARAVSKIPSYVSEIGFHPSMIDCFDLELSDAGPVS